MWPKDFRKKLVLTITVIVIASGLVISQIVTHRYSASLFQAAALQAENIAHNLALNAADKILVNDLVALQNLLDDRIHSNPQIAYLFIIKNHLVLTHTFSNGVPVRLLDANTYTNNQYGHLKKIISNQGDRYLDIAWPIFNGKAGTLRLGLSEKPLRKEIHLLWLQMSAITLGILMVSLLIAHFFIRRITRPLIQLTDTVDKIDEDNLDVSIEIEGEDEIARLAKSFKHKLALIRNYTSRLNDYTDRLEEKNRQLNRAHRQTKISFEIARKVGVLQNLEAVCKFLKEKLQGVIKCKNMVFIIFSNKKSVLFCYSGNRLKTEHGVFVDALVSFLSGFKEMKFLDRSQFPFVANELETAEKSILFPIRIENQSLGALCIGCPGDCECVTTELDMIELVLNQTAGVILRAVLYEDEIGDLKKRTEQTGFRGMIGKDPRMQVVYKLIEDVAPSDATVLIQGESGTGKEMVAHAIHQESHRKNKPFIVINCSAYPATLLESELFGHEKGAFTGALTAKPGRFEQANGGTVFLDEIGEISPAAQIKLLRVLQNKKIERIGGQETLSVDVRILAATHKDLLHEVKNGRFREDLFYRLNVIPIHLPPLRNRRNDIPILALHFLSLFSGIQNKTINGFTSEALRRLLDYSWPGNVRELANTIEHAVVLAKKDMIRASDLPTSFINVEPSPTETGHKLHESEKQHIIEVLKQCQWNKKKAAALLGIGRSTLYVKLKKYQIKSPTYH